jgi:hypothetical protein
MLTGRRQYRSSKHGLILQVEFCYFDFDATRWRCDWRDADVYDVMSFEMAVA